MWAASHLYCPSCPSESLEQTETNERVVDFRCPRCAVGLQLKAKKTRFGSKFANSAYEPKALAIRERRMPDYVLATYDLASWSLRDIAFVPGFFLTLGAIERRKPLSPTARRAGWVGSNVILANLPPDARVAAVEDGRARDPSDVRRDYRRFAALRQKDLDAATWTLDVLREVRRVARAPGAVFTLQDLYAAAEPRLAAEHPANSHIRDKIRQQLQVLRDRGVIEFVGRGVYRVVS